MLFKTSEKKIFVAGHNGMVGRAICKKLQKENCEILTVEKSNCDLRNQKEVNNWMMENKPEGVIICAAKVGGILANDSFPVDFLEDNLLIQTNLIKSSYNVRVEKLLFLGSSCIYPKEIAQPINENSLLTSSLEKTNEWYAIAKISGLKLCEAYRKQFGSDFISVMPTNLYGPGDNYDLDTSHVIPALIKKMHFAKLEQRKEVTIWGSGKPLREFMHVDDCAEGMIFLMNNYSEDSHINLGFGSEITILELAKKIKEIVGFSGKIVFDRSKPDGIKRKLLNSKKINDLGWRPKIDLEEGLKKTYKDYKVSSKI
tara:strand:+ start:1226 stop:2164 length:939 start_codon:yes stop_codon:yes gene_type:complete